MYEFKALTFNIHGGYLEAIVRGHRAGLLTAADYNNLCQCEILDDIKMHLSATDIGTKLTRDERQKLYSSFGLLYPYGYEELAVCEVIDQVRGVLEKYPPYQSIFAKLSCGESQMLDKAFYEEEVKKLRLVFE